MPLDSFQGKRSGAPGMDKDGRDAEALAVMDGTLMFKTAQTEDLTTAAEFKRLVLGQRSRLLQQFPDIQSMDVVHPYAIKYYEATILFGHALDSLLKTCGEGLECRQFAADDLVAQIIKQDYMSLSGPILFKDRSIFRSDAWLLNTVWGGVALPVYSIDVSTGRLKPLEASSGMSCQIGRWG
jgi:hypothetical protein